MAAAQIPAGWDVVPFGEGAVLVRFEARAAAAGLKAIAAALRATAAFDDVVAGSTEIAVLGGGDGLRAHVEATLAALEVSSETVRGTHHDLDVVFDGEDLERLASVRGVPARHLVDAFVERTYDVRIIGFLPGFAYLGDVPELLRFPRLAAPRKRVAPQTLAVAGDLAGVYPLASPGGWNLLGTVVGARMFDPHRASPALLGENDTVRFLISDDAHPRRRSAPPPLPSACSRPLRGSGRAGGEAAMPGAKVHATGLQVLRAPPGTSVQGGLRVGHRHLAVPWSGPLDAECARRANVAVGNAPDAPLIEIPPGTFAAIATTACLVSIDGEAPRALEVDASFEIPENDRFVRYLAVRGGFDVPRVLGSASTFLAGGFGGFAGRALVRGDVLGVGDAPATVRAEAPLSSDGPLVVSPGPHPDRVGPHALDVLFGGAFLVGAKSRIGTRLTGGVIPRDRIDDAPPEPMVPGAIQIATDGTPMILGPDAATTGGYPVLGVLDRAGLSRVGRARPGTPLRFVPAPSR